MDATTVAVDFAMTVFEVAVANAQWRITIRQRFMRTQFRRFLEDVYGDAPRDGSLWSAHYGDAWRSRQGIVSVSCRRGDVGCTCGATRRIGLITKDPRSGAVGRVAQWPEVDRTARPCRAPSHREQWIITGPRGSMCSAAYSVSTGVCCPPDRAPRSRRRPLSGGARHGTPGALRHALQSGTRRNPAACRRDCRHRAGSDPVCRPRSGRRALASTGVGPADGHRAGRHGRPHSRLWWGAPVCQLAWPDTPRILQWGAPTPGWHQQTRRPLSPCAAHPWGPRRAAGRAAPCRDERAVPPAPRLGTCHRSAARLQQSHQCHRQ